MATTEATPRITGTEGGATFEQPDCQIITNPQTKFRPAARVNRSVVGEEERKDLKRKVTDPNLEIVTMDPMYDFTLIVGRPEQPGGQKAFRVNQGCLRNASKAWRKKLSDEWRQSSASEVQLPDDSPFAFQVVLHLCHLQFDKLPFSLHQNELVEIAKLGNKYGLEPLLRVADRLKRWLEPFKGTSNAWQHTVNFQDFALITAGFGFEGDAEYHVNKLAMMLCVGKESYYYYASHKKENVDLRSDLPQHLQGKEHLT